MKVLHLINSLSAAGAELHLLTLCRHLKRAGVEVVIAYLKEHAHGSRSLRPDFEREGIRPIGLGGERRFDPRCLLRLARVLKAEKPDLLHTHLPRADFAGAVVKRWLCTVPWVASVHGIYSTHWSGSWSLPLFFFLWRRADRMIAISEAVKEWLVCEGRVPADKVAVVHYGIEVECFAQPGAEARKSAGRDRQALIGCVGRLDQWKGHDILIRAMPTILREVPGSCLLIAGHDICGYGRTLEVLIGEMGLNGCVRLVGFERDVPSFMHALDLFAFASRTEGFGQVVVEAMAAGKPVVASRIPPLTDIVVDRETGLLAEPDNPEVFAHAITWLLKHPDEAQEMGRRGLERVQNHFSAERMAAETLVLYETVLAQRRRREGAVAKKEAICRY